MKFRDDEKSSPESETIISRSVQVEGNFTGDGSMTIDGHVTGTVKTKGDLRIGPDAIIKADVEANNISLSGRVNGNVIAKEHLELSDSARITGNINTKSLTVSQGATINGKCVMKPTDEPDATETPVQPKRNSKEHKSS